MNPLRWRKPRKAMTMFDINRIIFTGRLTRDAEVRQISSGCIVTLAVASNSSYKDKEGNWHTDTAFIDVKVFGNAADRCQDFTKGTGVCVEGSLRQENWENKEGQKRSKLLVKADSVKRDRESASSRENGPEGQQTHSGGYNDKPKKDMWADSFDSTPSDDIPF